MTIKTFMLCSIFAVVFTGCASEGGSGSSGVGGGTRAAYCKSGDSPIASASQCLQDDAACYQLTNDSWCTGERGVACPTGSNAIPAGSACPSGARCFKVSEAVSCIVNY